MASPLERASRNRIGIRGRQRPLLAFSSKAEGFHTVPSPQGGQREGSRTGPLSPSWGERGLPHWSPLPKLGRERTPALVPSPQGRQREDSRIVPSPQAGERVRVRGRMRQQRRVKCQEIGRGDRIRSG